MLRAFEKEKGYEAIQKDLIGRLKALKNPEAQKILTEALTQLGFEFESAMKAGPDSLSGNARSFAMTLTRIYIGALLNEFADQTGDARDILAAHHWLLHRSLKADLRAVHQSLV